MMKFISRNNGLLIWALPWVLFISGISMITIGIIIDPNCKTTFSLFHVDVVCDSTSKNK